MSCDNNSKYNLDQAVKKVASECNVPESEVIEAIKKLLEGYSEKMNKIE